MRNINAWKGALGVSLILTIAFATSSAEAARIYNNTSYPFISACSASVYVPSDCVKIAKGERSESLNWTKTTQVYIFYHEKEIIKGIPNKIIPIAKCIFNFGAHAHMQGGNYAVITDGTSNLYDSNKAIIATC